MYFSLNFPSFLFSLHKFSLPIEEPIVLKNDSPKKSVSEKTTNEENSSIEGRPLIKFLK